MNPIGMHYGFWSHNWDEIAYIPLMEKLAWLGFDICEVASAEWGYYDDARLRELKACADHNGLGITYSIGLEAKYDLASDDPAVRENGIRHVTRILESMPKVGATILNGVSYAGWQALPDHGITLDEKRRKEEARLERQRRLEEEKKNRGKKHVKKDEPTEPGVNKDDSRIGIRAYARGRAYIPERFGGVTEYRDMSDLLQAEIDAEQQKKGKKNKKAAPAQEKKEETAQKPETEALPKQETAPAEQLLRALLCLRLRRAGNFKREADVAQDRPLLKQVEALEDHADLPAYLQKRLLAERRQVLPVDPDLAGGRTFEQVDAAHQRRFARAGQADDTEDLAVRDGQVHILQRFHAAGGRGIDFAEVFQLDHGKSPSTVF